MSTLSIFAFLNIVVYIGVAVLVVWVLILSIRALNRYLELTAPDAPRRKE